MSCTEGSGPRPRIPDTSTTAGTRSELQECALSAGMLMFGVLLERLTRLIREGVEVPPGGGPPPNPTPKLVLSEDAKVILPAIKVWCDWMMANFETWNPPPCCADFKIGKSNVHDPWSELAVLMNVLKSLDTNRSILLVERKEGYETVRLPEDITLAGFLPLKYEPEPIFVHRECDMEEAQNVLRIQKLLYFGTDRLCSCVPPVLRRECAGPGASDGGVRFYSVVQNRGADGLNDVDILLESFSDDELETVDGGETDTRQKTPPPEETPPQTGPGAASSTDSGILSGSSSNSPNSLETRRLLRRKDELERKQRMQEKYNQRLQEMDLKIASQTLVVERNEDDVLIGFKIALGRTYGIFIPTAASPLPPARPLPHQHSLREHGSPVGPCDRAGRVCMCNQVPDILSQSTIAVSIEVTPRFLVPDTNCFVDCLSAIEVIANTHPLYQLMVPIIVINELEGLSKGIRHQSPKHQPTTTVSIAEATLQANPIDSAGFQHAAKVADASKKALQFIKSRNPAVKCVTTKGSVLKTFSFTVEDDVGELKSNDDRILETALNLCRNPVQETRAGTRYVTLNVVLLTTDRNLRVKAISNDLPVRELADFIKWAGLGA
uniref:PIN domain-containing protein n=1 Tax=Anopheles farauti TaxID=69004 RepID=A0A182QUX2_9DIPT